MRRLAATWTAAAVLVASGLLACAAIKTWQSGYMSDLKAGADYDPNKVGHAIRGYGSTIAAAACISTIDLILLFVIPMLTRREELPTWVEYQVHAAAAPAHTSRAPYVPLPHPPDARAT